MTISSLASVQHSPVFLDGIDVDQSRLRKAVNKAGQIDFPLHAIKRTAMDEHTSKSRCKFASVVALARLAANFGLPSRWPNNVK
jgi:hypothetical protein